MIQISKHSEQLKFSGMRTRQKLKQKIHFSSNPRKNAKPQKNAIFITLNCLVNILYKIY